MKLPKIRFLEMTLKENIDIIKWTYFDDSDLLNIHDYTIQYFPELANIDKSLSKEKIHKIIEKVVTDNYEKYKEKIKIESERYNSIWIKYNEIYFEALSKYLNIKWPDNLEVIEASVGLIPVFPRYLESFSFSLSIGMEESQVIDVVAHETLHFLWFEKWKQLYPSCPKREYDSPYITWQYSEMVTDPILNSEEINSILNINEKSYDSFYEIKDGDLMLMDNIKKIYKSNKKIEDKIVEGFDYIKRILENQKDEIRYDNKR